jgi:hypothetical protein
MSSEDANIRSQQRQQLESLLSAGNADCRFQMSYPAGQEPATAAGDLAASGKVGELISATVAPGAVNLTSTTAANVASIALTKGDWDVSGVVNYTPAASTSITTLAQGASTSTGALGAQDTYSGQVRAAWVPGANVLTEVIPNQPLELASNTTVYLVALATFSVSTLTAGGTIRARRRR